MSRAHEMSCYDSNTASPTTAHPRRWLQFSLRTLLVFTLLASAFFGWLGSILVRVRKQREIVAQIQSNDGAVSYHFLHDGLDNRYGPPAGPAGPAVLRWLLGDDTFEYVEAVAIPGPVYHDVEQHAATDSDLACLAELPRLQELYLIGPVTDQGLINLGRIRRLRFLNLEPEGPLHDLAPLAELADLECLLLHGQSVTDSALNHLERLKKLTILCLYDTQITSAGTAGVGQLTNLRELNLDESPGFDDEAMKHLAALKQVADLHLRKTSVTDTGLHYLSGFENLKKLDLGETAVGDQGVELISRLVSLETLDLSDTQMTDASGVHLAKLRNLRSLSLGPNVSLEAAQRLKAHLPKCCIYGWRAPDTSFTIETDGSFSESKIPTVPRKDESAAPDSPPPP
jgi:Leucine Rich repeat